MQHKKAESRLTANVVRHSSKVISHTSLVGPGNAHDIRQNVHGSKCLDRLLHQPCYLIFPGDIDPRAHGLAAYFSNNGHHLVFLHLLRRHITDRDRGSFPPKLKGNGFCVPSGGTGYDGNFPFQNAHMVVLLVLNRIYFSSQEHRIVTGPRGYL